MERLLHITKGIGLWPYLPDCKRHLVQLLALLLSPAMDFARFSHAQRRSCSACTLGTKRPPPSQIQREHNLGHR
eukprot:scaffold121523_cov19-Tisochrysis_lutea.AAC.1